MLLPCPSFRSVASQPISSNLLGRSIIQNGSSLFGGPLSGVGLQQKCAECTVLLDKPNAIGEQLNPALPVMNENNSDLLSICLRLASGGESRLRRAIQTYLRFALYPDLPGQFRFSHRCMSILSILRERNRCVILELRIVVKS